MDMIKVESLTKKFAAKTVLHGISFSVTAGEILGFLGPNGAGKTTTMRILSGYLPPNDGRVEIAGMDITEKPREVKGRIGYLPEAPPLYTEMTVDAYLYFVAALKQIPRSKRSRSVETVVEQCNIGDVRGRIIGNLSRGYRQRVGLAQALVHEPELLILDEPTSGLDPKQIIEIRELVKGLRGDHTIVLSTHILPEATLTCERVIIINEGRLVAVDSIESLSRGVASSRAIRVMIRRKGEAFREALSKTKDVRSIKVLENNAFLVEGEQEEDLMEEVARLAVEGGYGLTEINRVKPGLEEIFLRLTGSGEVNA